MKWRFRSPFYKRHVVSTVIKHTVEVVSDTKAINLLVERPSPSYLGCYFQPNNPTNLLQPNSTQSNNPTRLNLTSQIDFFYGLDWLGWVLFFNLGRVYFIMIILLHQIKHQLVCVVSEIWTQFICMTIRNFTSLG